MNAKDAAEKTVRDIRRKMRRNVDLPQEALRDHAGRRRNGNAQLSRVLPSKAGSGVPNILTPDTLDVHGVTYANQDPEGTARFFVGQNVGDMGDFKTTPNKQ